MTYDIFLTACIQDADVQKARTIISGVTERRERHQFTRIQHYEPQDPSVRGFSTIKQLQKDRASATGAPPWQELHQILVKQPSFFHLRTDITEETRNAQTQNSAAVHVPAGKLSVVRWTDLPDPENARFPFATQRRVVDVADSKAEAILAENKFRTRSHLIEESYQWWFNGIEYELLRSFTLAPNQDSAAPPQIPNPSSLKPVSPLWILHVRAVVDSAPSDTMPERMKQGLTRLVQVRETFKGVFDFKIFDRRCHDTRIQVPRAA